MANIYDQHRAAFNRVSAFVILHQNYDEVTRVATLAVKFPADGAGRLYAYLHVHGGPMVRGFAGGYGYDKTGAAVEDAARKILLESYGSADDFPQREHAERLKAALENIGGSDWARCVEKAGYTVLQAV